MADELNVTGKEQKGTKVSHAVEKIDVEQIRTAQETFKKYREGRKKLDERIVKNEDWWKINNWEKFEKKTENGTKPRSAWLFNSINNKHADFMDNFPSPNVLPREASDEKTAEALSAVLPVILEQCDFETVYSANMTDKLKNGVAIYGVYFNPQKNGGLGDIDIRAVDILNIYWEPGVQDIQDSENIFVTTIMSNTKLKNMYPDVLGDDFAGGGNMERTKYNFDDTIEDTGKSQVVDWYYKVNVDGKDILHYVKYVGDYILFSSQGDPAYNTTGFYAHGMYPFVVDVLFTLKGTPAGFGYIDIMTSPQEYIDKLGGAVLDNALWGSKPRFFIKDDADLNEKELADLDKNFIRVSGGDLDVSRIRPVDFQAIHGNYLTVLQQKIDELKETSGNRDFSQGSTAAGVTAASAIAALQEAGSKTSRDMIKGSYRAYIKICNMCIELIRQFYDEPRVFRIIGEDGNTKYTDFNNANLLAGTTNEFGIEFTERVPIFDIKVKAQKTSPYAREAQNELALMLFDKGFFNPEYADMALACLELMEFEGKEKVRAMISQNKMMLQQMQGMQQSMSDMAGVIAQTTGDGRLVEAVNQAHGTMPQSDTAGEELPETTGAGDIVDDKSRLGRVREQANRMTEVR